MCYSAVSYPYLDASWRQIIENIEKNLLKPLPPERVNIPLGKVAEVNIDYHVELAWLYYSIPYRFVGRAADIRATSSTVEIFESGIYIAIHPRYCERPRPTTISASTCHRAHAELSSEHILQWAQDLGQHVAILC